MWDGLSKQSRDVSTEGCLYITSAGVKVVDGHVSNMLCFCTLQVIIRHRLFSIHSFNVLIMFK